MMDKKSNGGPAAYRIPTHQMSSADETAENGELLPIIV